MSVKDILARFTNGKRSGERGIEHTAEGDIVVVVELVDGLDLATNVELLNGVVQVHDSRVLWVTAEDELSLSSPKIRGEPRQQAPL